MTCKEKLEQAGKQYIYTQVCVMKMKGGGSSLSQYSIYI